MEGHFHWLKCKEEFNDEKCWCMTNVEAVDLASTVLALRQIGNVLPTMRLQRFPADLSACGRGSAGGWKRL